MGSLRTTFHLRKRPPCPVRLLTCCRAKQSRHCSFHDIPICVLSSWWSEMTKNNHDVGDCFACTIPFLVHELVLYNRSSAVSMTNLADSDVRRNKLVSCFSNLILLPKAHSPGLIYSLKSCPCGNVCSFQLNGICLKENVLRCDTIQTR